MPVLRATPLVNAIVARARSLPELIEMLPPAMAEQLETKPLLLSKSPWGTLAAAVLAWVSTRYGLGWDEATCSVIAGAAVLLGSYAMRAMTKQPIAGVVTTPPLPAPMSDASAVSVEGNVH